MTDLVFCHLYDWVRLFFGIKIKDGTRTVLHTGSLLPDISHMTSLCIDDERLWSRYWMNSAFGEKFTALTNRELTPSDIRVSFRPEDVSLRAVCLDDIAPSVPAHLLVETSLDSWQGHWLLARPANDAEVRSVIKLLRSQYASDIAATDPRHCRRFLTPGLRCLEQWGRPVDVDEAVRLHPVTEKIVLPRLSFKPHYLSGQATQSYMTVWRDKFEMTGDKSRADFALAQHLLSTGGSPDAAAAAIRICRTTLEEDKQGRVEDYLQRTVAKALLILNQV